MRQLILISVAVLILLGSCKTKINNYNGLPLIKAESVKADYRIGNDWFKGGWNISPHIEFDSLFITCYSKDESFAFYTDNDSISFYIKAGEVKKFYVGLNDTSYARTVVKGISPNFKTLQFDSISKNSNFKIWYEKEDNEYLSLLRAKYPIDSLIRNAKSDTKKAQIIMNWVHKQWKHNGDNEPKKSDAISILEEVKEGKNFRCVEYGIVTFACLNAVGLKSRTLSLRTKNVETTKYGAGHVLLEVYLNDLKKWVFLDPQWDVMPVVNGVPLNAIEFQKAISEQYQDVEIVSESGVSKRYYIDWIYPYLYYFVISFDNRVGIDLKLNKIDEKMKLMLVPIGAKNPTVFQINNPINDCIYTNFIKDFYQQPK